MPAYNAAAYIAEAIQSVLLQTFRDFELLIINDGSSDNTVQVIRSFNDERIVLIQQENLGVAAALNNGLQYARANYIARFDADDICFPERLQVQYDFITAHPEYIIIGAAAEYIDASGNYIFTHHPQGKTDQQIKQLPYNVCPFIHASVLYKRESVQRAGYNVHAHSFEDHLLWQQLMQTGKMYNMAEPLLKVRLNPGSLTMDERKRKKEFQAIKNKVLRAGTINAVEGEKLLALIRDQDNPKSKEGAYYSLLAKKFLWNNYDPAKSRSNVKKAITLNDFDAKDYLLWFISFLPKRMISTLYTIFISPK